MKSKKIIGIDLGSYNSAVAVHEVDGVKIIPNSEGGLTTPSYVAFTKQGEIKIGDPAKRQAVANPENTIFNVKRLMGKTYEQVKHLKRPYKIVDNDGRAAIDINGKIYNPEEISAMIIQKMKKTAEDYLGEEIEHAIITVPAFFNSDERQATKTAGEIAGLIVDRIISEPTAASLCIKSEKNKVYAVYDFGGQTMDLSIVDIADDVYEIKSTDGDLDLGGCLIDEKIVDWLSDEFMKEYNTDLRKDPMALQRLVDAAEKAKIELSTSTSTDINLPYITVLDSVPIHLTKNLNKSKFEQLIEPIIDRTIDKAKSALSKLNKEVTVDEVLLVGGSSRIPLAQEKLKALFNREPNKSLNPDHCVAIGAAIQGGVISGDVHDLLLLDVIPLSVGIETMGNIMTTMISANTTIPFKKSEVFSTASDNQPSVEINILQGERPLAKDNKQLGRFHLEGIMQAPRGIPKIEVTIDIDANSIMSVSAKDQATGKSQSIRIEGSSNLSKDDIEKMKRDAELNSDKDKKEKEKIDTINQADSIIFQTEKQIKEFDKQLSDDDKSKLEEQVKILKTAHSSKDVDSIKTEMNNLNEVWSVISTKMYEQSNTNNTSNEEKTEKPEDVPYEEVK